MHMHTHNTILGNIQYGYADTLDRSSRFYSCLGRCAGDYQQM